MKFSEFCRFQEGYVNPSQKNNDYFDGEVKWLRATDLNNSYVYNTTKNLTKKGFDSAGKSAFLFKPETLAISKSGTIGRLGILKDYMCGNRAVINIEVDESKMNKMYVFYWLKLNLTYIQGLAVGSVQKNLYVSALEKLEIGEKTLREQKSIANILSTLDEKIEVNKQINKTLENMAQAIFKQWFVDFEFPNEDGEPYKSSGGEMVESELGMIPKGWKLKILSELGKVITGKTPSTKDESNFGVDFNFVTPRDVNEDLHIIKTERQLSVDGAKKIKNCKVTRNSIGVTCIGSNLGKVYINSSNSYTNQQINSLELSNEFIYPYVFMVLKGYRENFINMSSGSAVPIINKTTFSLIKIIMPKERILNAFVNITDGIFRTIEANQYQINALSRVRDTLLPKLMSGEIRVPIDSEDEAS